MPGRAAALLAGLSICSIGLQSCRTLGPSSFEPIGEEIRAQVLKGYVAVPDGYDETIAYPLVVGLHGNGGSPGEFSGAFTGFGSESLIVAVAQGEYQRSNGGYGWFYQTSDRSLWEAYDTRSVSTLAELIDTVRARYRIGKVFVLGFSEGASLAYMIGLRNPSLVSGVLAVSGNMPEVDQVGSIVHAADIDAARGVKLFIAHGWTDTAVPREVFTAQRDFFVSRGYDVTGLEYAGGHFFTDDLRSGIRQWLREKSR